MFGINAHKIAIEYDIKKYFKSRSKTIGLAHNWHVRFFSQEHAKIEMPVTKNAIVDSKNGDPKTAPNATSSPIETFVLENIVPIIATIGTIVSGRAVPIAARIPPIALSVIPYFFPQYSTEFVNKMQAYIISAKNISIIRTCTKFIIIMSFFVLNLF